MTTAIEQRVTEMCEAAEAQSGAFGTVSPRVILKTADLRELLAALGAAQRDSLALAELRHAVEEVGRDLYPSRFIPDDTEAASYLHGYIQSAIQRLDYAAQQSPSPVAALQENTNGGL